MWYVVKEINELLKNLCLSNIEMLPPPLNIL